MICKTHKLWMMSLATVTAAGLAVLPACEDETAYDGGVVDEPVIDEPVVDDPVVDEGVFQDMGREIDAGLDRTDEALEGAGAELERGIGELGRETEEGLGELEEAGDNLGNELEGAALEGEELEENLEQQDGPLPPAEQPAPLVGE